MCINSFLYDCFISAAEGGRLTTLLSAKLYSNGCKKQYITVRRKDFSKDELTVQKYYYYKFTGTQTDLLRMGACEFISRLFYQNCANQQFPNGIVSERENRTPPSRLRRGVNYLELSSSQKKTIRHQFDSFCKKVLREESRDYMRELSRRAEHEVSLSELSAEQMEQLFVVDEYPSDQYHFDILGHHIAVKDDRVGEALSVLPKKQRDIILLSYFLDLTDKEIGEKLNMVRYTVQRRRTSSLKEMKLKMEVKQDE